jgi:hypothetical protein
MVRTLVTLDDDDKAWLDTRARETGVSMAQVVREAVRQYRAGLPESRSDKRRRLLEQLKGTWRNGDGLAWQRERRAEWDGRTTRVAVPAGDQPTPDRRGTAQVRARKGRA